MLNLFNLIIAFIQGHTPRMDISYASINQKSSISFQNKHDPTCTFLLIKYTGKRKDFRVQTFFNPVLKGEIHNFHIFISMDSPAAELFMSLDCIMVNVN